LLTALMSEPNSVTLSKRDLKAKESLERTGIGTLMNSGIFYVSC
jgi:hypothetical protein